MISPAEGNAQEKGSLLVDIERMIVLQLRNRFLWMSVGISALLITQLTLLQINGASGRSPFGSGMSTFDLLASLMLMIECVTICVMLLSILSESALVTAWRQRWPGRPFSYLAAGLSCMPAQFIAALVLLLPTLYIHRYPELSAAQNISIPLTLMQRFLLVFLAIQVAGNLTLILRWFTPLPRWLAALLGLCAYWGFGFWLTWSSYTDDRFMRFNDLFFYNQLSRHIDGFPELMRSRVVLDIHRDFLNLFLWLLGAAVLTTLLWLPRAALETDRRRRQGVDTSGLSTEQADD